MSKYIIDIPNGVEWGVVTCRTEDGFYTRDFDSLEELNSDYINEHFGDLQDTAYQKGVNDGSLDVKQRVEGAYQRGLDDAWECARELYLNGACKDLFGEYFNTFIKNHTAQEAIAKLKAYEEKQKADNKIEVGDEVNWLGDCFIVTRIFQPRNGKEQCDGIDDDGCVYHDVLIKDLEKTGRHFDIQKILEEMRND